MMETVALLFEFLAEEPLEALGARPRARTEYADEGAGIGGQRLSAKLGAMRIWANFNT